MSAEQQQIEAAISALESQRATLGDAVIDMALAPLRARLAGLCADELPGQSLKQVTILFLDIVGSTKLSQHLDPEQISDVMDGALARFSAIIEAHSGKVLKYAGDSILAVFGANQAREDDAEHAVRAGLALLAEGRFEGDRVQRQHGYDGFNVRVGLHTGGVLLGGGVDAESSIRGQSVNIAARMEQTAPAGALRISQDTYRQVRGAFDVEPQPPLAVNGLDEPIVTYLVQGARALAFRVASRGIDGIETQMIGRDAELARLIEAFERTLRERKLSVVTVVGDAGVGKSRLLFEFEHWLERNPGPSIHLQGRSRPYGENVPYGLMRDMLAGRFDIAESDSRAVAQAKLAQGLRPVFGDRAAEQTALLGQLIGLNYSLDPHIAGIASDARQIRDRAFHAGVQYLRLLSRQSGAPILLMFDDLQWADEGSLDFIQRVATSAVDVPLLALCLARPALYERRALWGDGPYNHERIDLEPLSEGSSRELADALLQRLEAVPTALRDLVTSGAEGNPFFAEELVGMLIDDGVIVTGPASWRVVTEKLRAVDVPPTLANVLQARLDGLPGIEKAALQQASVIGHVFWDEALRCIAPAAPEALDALTRRDLARCRETTAFEGTREFVFKHHLLHQVTYDSVLKRQKRRQHRQAADWLVLRSGERANEYFGLIADHYERAGETANAVLYLRKAGEEAARGFANLAALDHFGRALALVPTEDPESRFQILLARRDVLSNTGRRAEQAADLVTIEQVADAMDDNVKRARAAGLRSSYSLVVADYPAVAAAAAKSVALAESAGVPEVALMARINWGRALQFQGDYAGAQRRLDEVLALVRGAAGRLVLEQRLESVALGQLGILARQVDRYSDARNYYDQALHLARNAGDRMMEIAMLNNRGDIERYLGNYSTALELLATGRRVCQDIGSNVNEAYLLCTMAQVASVRGDLAQALEWLNQTLPIAVQTRGRDLESANQCVRGHALAGLGRLDEASAAYLASVALYREIGRPTMVSEPLAGLARVALAKGLTDDAMDHVTEIVSYVDGGGSFAGTEDPLWIYLTCHQVLRAADSPRSIEFLRLGRDLLLLRAGLLSETERASFLDNVPSHRAIMASWESIGAS